MAWPLLGVLGSILGNDKVISKGMDLIDDAFTSEEESRESKTKAKIDLMKAYAPFKVAQRYLALMFGANFTISFWVAVIMWGRDKDMKGFLEIMGAFNLGWIMTAVVIFYFGAGMAEGTISELKKKGGD